jgi:hypothetical protein
MSTEEWVRASEAVRQKYIAVGCGMRISSDSTCELDDVLAVERGRITEAGEAMGFRYVLKEPKA